MLSGGLTPFIVLALALLAAPTRAIAQTIDLGSGQYGVFEESNGTSKGGVFTLTRSTIVGNVELGPNTSFTNSSSSITANSGKPLTDVSAAPTAISSYTATNLGDIGDSTPTITGTGSINVYSVGNMNLSSGSLTIKGTANEMFVFNVSGSVSVASSSIVLSGVNASQVIFNVIGGNVSIKSSTSNGTFVDQKGTITLTSSTETGAVVSGGNISVTGSTVNADAFLRRSFPPRPRRCRRSRPRAWRASLSSRVRASGD